MFKDYVKISFDEWVNLFYVSLSLSALFSISINRFLDSSLDLIFLLIKIFIFIFVLLSSRLFFMKSVAYKNGFCLNMYLTYLDKYWFAFYDKLSYHKKKIPNVGESVEKFKDNFKGLPSTIVSIFIYFLTLGIFIYPSLWNFKNSKIPHRHIGTRMIFESNYFHETSEYRISKALFMGFIFYFLFAVILKLFSSVLGLDYYNIFTVILYYIAFISLIPFPASEGFELWRKNSFAWINAIMILIITMISLLIFESYFYLISVSIISLISVFSVLLWRDLMK